MLATSDSTAIAVGAYDGKSEGDSDNIVGAVVGAIVGVIVGVADGDAEGDAVGVADGAVVGDCAMVPSRHKSSRVKTSFMEGDWAMVKQ